MPRRPKKGSELKTVAVEMRRMLTGTDAKWVHRKLPGGLEVVLQRREETWRLAIGRRGVFPSAAEVEICRAAFDVPVAAEFEQRATLHHQVWETTWRELAPVEA